MKKTLLCIAILSVVAMMSVGYGFNDGDEDNKQPVASVVTVNDMHNGHEYVDLGLPSGTLWGACNMGGWKSPEYYYSYFAWGEPRIKKTYSWENYCHAKGAYNKLTKYCNKSSLGNKGFTDKLTTLQTADDPAALWGKGWHSPTKSQIEELLKNTSHRWITQKGVAGLLFIGKNGNAIFLPAGGSLDEWSDGSDVGGNEGFYWSASLKASDPTEAWSLYFNEDVCTMESERLYNSSRSNGFSVRPVLDKKSLNTKN